MILDGAETGDTDDGCLELNSAEVCTSIENFNEVRTYILVNEESLGL